jgi:hypothetical protein
VDAHGNAQPDIDYVSGGYNHEEEITSDLVAVNLTTNTMH